MPLYEYRCAKCGETFEVLQKFADTPLTVHEACGGTVERLISRSGFSLKGSGWYATDYPRSGAAAKDPGESKTESKPSETKTETKTETKSETKTESKPASTTTKND